MNRKDFQQISRMRLKESSVLLKAGEYAGAYYLAGYSIECAIKSCIAKQTRRSQFPDKDLAFRAYTHDLWQLLGAAGLAVAFQNEMRTNAALEVNWTVVKDWKESARYDVIIPESQARDFYSACIAHNSGILSWIKKRW